MGPGYSSSGYILGYSEHLASLLRRSARMGYCFVMIFGYSQGLKKHTTLFQTYNEESQAFSMGLYLCICTYICKYVAGGAYMPLAGTSRVQGIKVGFKGVKEEPC